jgi:hypothetical protein
MTHEKDSGSCERGVDADGETKRKEREDYYAKQS